MRTTRTRTSNEQAGHLYFGIFLMMAIIGGWVIWKSNQWFETAARRQIVVDAKINER